MEEQSSPWSVDGRSERISAPAPDPSCDAVQQTVPCEPHSNVSSTGAGTLYSHRSAGRWGVWVQRAAEGASVERFKRQSSLQLLCTRQYERYIAQPPRTERRVMQNKHEIHRGLHTFPFAQTDIYFVAYFMGKRVQEVQKHLVFYSNL